MECWFEQFIEEVAARLTKQVIRVLECPGHDAVNQARRGTYEVLVFMLAHLDADAALYKKGIPSKLRARLYEAFGENASLDRTRWAMLGKAKWHVLTPGAKFGMRRARNKQQQQEIPEDEEDQLLPSMECWFEQFIEEVAARLTKQVIRVLECPGHDAVNQARRGTYEVLVFMLAHLDADAALYKKGIPSKLRARLYEAFGENASLDRTRWAMLGKAKWHVLTPGEQTEAAGDSRG